MVSDSGKPSMSRPTGMSPLLHFKGRMKGYEMQDRTFESRTYKVVVFDFTDVEVIEATEPYPFPIAQIQVGYNPPSSSRGNTKWEALASSVRKLIGGEPDLDEHLVGKMQEWQQLLAPQTRRNDESGEWEVVQELAWQVVSLEGTEAPEDLTDHILTIAEGKNESQFHEALLQDAKIRARPDLVSAITERKLLTALLDSKKLERDAEGILHTTASATASDAVTH